MPEATPSAQETPRDNASTAPEEEAAAAVPDTDKFLESILNSTESSDSDDAVQTTSSQEPADSPVPAPPSIPQTPSPSPTIPSAENSTVVPLSGDSQDVLSTESDQLAKSDSNLNSTFSATDTSTNEPAESTPTDNGPESVQKDDFLKTFTSEQNTVPINQSQETMQDQAPSTFSNPTETSFQTMDGVANDIRQGEEPPKSVVDSPPAMMPPKQPSKKSSRGLLVAVVLILAAVAAYLLYTSFFAAQDSYQSSDTQDDLVSDEAEESYLTQTNDEVRKSDLAKIYQALKNYYSATGKYPFAESRVSLNNSDNVLEKELVSAGYLTILPADPDAQKYYAYKSDGTTFSLTAVLDEESDPEATIIDSLAIYEITQETVSVNSSNADEGIYLPEEEDYSSNPFYPSGSSQSDIE
ncbi:MAG: Bacterial type II secretion system protein G [candidate division WS2 bacterium ADurb.Bin280]|uniref:Bacterial type II secretion system protein G n=1 Tax=candidate division WS2 bacterium ADurb.Bin280 TaxID=1852829 RepID=A0A1V5SCR3_9BACT|nr:MAG: Bacterial type II secretion system protein G [candidate division WS2 bacterium ADurb.Bin280]